MAYIVPPKPVNKDKITKAKAYDLDNLISIDLIREHTKTDDVPQYSDDLLRLYRAAALEAAQEYTGLLVFERKVITESVTPPIGSKWRKSNYFTHDTNHPFGEPIAWYYGLHNSHARQVGVDVGTSRVQLPHDHDNFGLGCCNPCGDGSDLARLQYVAGYSCEDDIPSAIVLGALKYIAHVLENAGDNVITNNVSGGTGSESVKLNQASDPAFASGAIQIWRMVKRDAI